MSTSCRPWIVLGLGICAGVFVAGQCLGARPIEAQFAEPEPSRHRLECFELRRLPDAPAVGYATLHRTQSASSTSLEWQIHFPEEDLRIWHTETRDKHGRRWIWREASGPRTRSVITEQSGSELEVTEWGRLLPWRAKLAAGGSSAFPLELEERLRNSEIVAPGPENLALFDPMSNEVESVRLKFRDPDPAAVAGLRHAELVREDGTLAGSWTFLGQELVSFAWQRGGLIAVRVEADRVARRFHATLENAKPASLTNQR